MAFLNIFKPKWQHSDPTVRLQAVQSLPEADLQTLAQIAAGDTEAKVRLAAQHRINDRQQLTGLLTTATEQAIIDELTERIDALQLRELFAAQDNGAKMAALTAITKESLLARVAEEEAEPAEIRLAAVERLSDQEALAALVSKNCGKAVALAAVDKISDETILRRLAQEAASRAARARAQQKVDEIEEERDRPLRLERERAGLLEQARHLSASTNFGPALIECQQLQNRWRQITDSTDTRTQQLDEFCALLRQRQQEEAARIEARLAAQREQQQHLERLAQIPSEIDTLAKGVSGAEETGFASLHEEWSTLTSKLETQPSPDLQQRYTQASEAFSRSRTLIAHESAEEANLLRALAAIPSFIDTDDLEKALDSLSEAQRTFYGWQPQLVNRQHITERLALLQDQHRAATARREEAQAVLRQTNLQRRVELLAEMKGLLATEDIRQAEPRLKEIKELWRKPVDLPNDAPDLQPEFAETARLFAEKLAAVRQEETWQRWQNKTLKEQLIEAAEALDESTDLRQVFKRIKELQESWRTTGPAPAKEENPLWRRFQHATERNFARCRTYFQTLDEEAERNLQEKIILRDLAAAHQDSCEWQKNADFIKELQAQWKAIGRGPKEREEAVFQSFRAACDHFFERRKAHHEALDQERQAHLSQKEELCLRAEALADQPEITHKEQFQELQTTWKTIGQVPKGQEEAIWQRFRAACNRYYDWLDTLRPDNLAEKEALCAAVEEISAAIGPETNFMQVAKKVVALQRRWKEIGPVPKEHQQSIWQRFKGLCDAFYAAKKQHDEAIDQERPENQSKMEAFIERIKELSVAAVSRESVKEIIAIQEEWHRLGPAGKESERPLQERFKSLCDTFFKERREALQEIDQIQRENLKKKEALCLRLEILAGINPQPVLLQGKGQKGGLTLAEQLKVAFETNFVLAADDARDKKKRAKDEIDSVKQEWQQIGAVPREHEHILRKRYSTALDAALKL